MTKEQYFKIEKLRAKLNKSSKYFNDFRKELIKNSEISFDNKSIVFDIEWFYNNVEKRNKK